MIRLERLNEPAPVPYVAKYGSRSGLRSAKRETSVVDLSFVRPRKGLNLSEVQDLTPEFIADMRYFIKNGLAAFR